MDEVPPFIDPAVKLDVGDRNPHRAPCAVYAITNLHERIKWNTCRLQRANFRLVDRTSGASHPRSRQRARGGNLKPLKPPCQLVAFHFRSGDRKHAATVVLPRQITFYQCQQRTFLEPLIQHAVENRGLQSANPERKGGLTERVAYPVQALAVAQRPACDQLVPVGNSPLSGSFGVLPLIVQRPTFALILRERCTGRAQQFVEQALPILAHDCGAEDLVVAAIPEALDAEIVGHSRPLELIQAPLHGGDAQRIHLPDSDREPIPAQMAAADLVRVPAGPEHVDSFVINLNAGRIVQKMD